ncbi:MAG: glycosyltransferase [Alphaproteobacteria bacterium]|nr:glycosyltransferase [Alphaproteobacteria bacterium]HPF47948.1 glycosyltransferase [Emcibacteraceae bacterium]HRW30685.1 glycosyltransferase [Emcibacteraceae bacterium]
MKILIVSGFFPPYAPVSGSRVNKLARFLEIQGHDIRVLAPKRKDQGSSLTPEISEDKIIFTEFTDINAFPSYLKQSVKRLFSTKESDNISESSPEAEKKEDAGETGEESNLSLYYRKLTNIPDRTIGWYPKAIGEGRKLFKSWSPDIIFTTVPPFTCLLVASKLARINDVPWVADYRDLWSDHGYYHGSGFKKKIDRFIEKRALANCNGLITVTQSWVETLKKSRNIPVQLAMNGFDPNDFDGIEKKELYPDYLTILYAGALYEGKRDPQKLFEALAKLGNDAKKIKVLLYTEFGADELSESQKKIIKVNELEEQVVCSKYIPQSELHKIMAGTDIMMLLRWDDPRENSVIAGKLFEYIGTGKPILSVGGTEGEAADIIRDNNFGLVSNDVDEIAEYLKTQLQNKKTSKANNNPNKKKFERSTQFEKLEKFMQDIVERT